MKGKKNDWYGTVYQYLNGGHYDLDTGQRLVSGDEILKPFDGLKVKITIEELTEGTVEGKLMTTLATIGV